MPYAVKKPHPTRPNVMLYHTWDPDGDGYEEVRKFPDIDKANNFAANHSGAVVVEIGYEISQTDEEIAEKYEKSIDPTQPHGSVTRLSVSSEDNPHPFAPESIRAFTAHGILG